MYPKRSDQFIKSSKFESSSSDENHKNRGNSQTMKPNLPVASSVMIQVKNKTVKTDCNDATNRKTRNDRFADKVEITQEVYTSRDDSTASRGIINQSQKPVTQSSLITAKYSNASAKDAAAAEMMTMVSEDRFVRSVASSSSSASRSASPALSDASSHSASASASTSQHHYHRRGGDVKQPREHKHRKKSGNRTLSNNNGRSESPNNKSNLANRKQAASKPTASTAANCELLDYLSSDEEANKSDRRAEKIPANQITSSGIDKRKMDGRKRGGESGKLGINIGALDLPASAKPSSPPPDDIVTLLLGVAPRKMQIERDMADPRIDTEQFIWQTCPPNRVVHCFAMKHDNQLSMYVENWTQRTFDLTDETPRSRQFLLKAYLLKPTEYLKQKPVYLILMDQLARRNTAKKNKQQRESKKNKRSSLLLAETNTLLGQVEANRSGSKFRLLAIPPSWRARANQTQQHHHNYKHDDDNNDNDEDEDDDEEEVDGFDRWESARNRAKLEMIAIQYEKNLLGYKGPNNLSIFLPPISRRSGLPLDFLELNEDKSLNLSSVGKSQMGTSENTADENSVEHRREDSNRIIILKNKLPIWNQKSKSFQLNFHGRVSKTSPKNFFIIHSKNENLKLLQIGKRKKNEMIVDYTYPFCALQAFAFIISNFHYKFVCD